ncbi:TetR/AcrR family transcriptional regulator [Parafrankia sp. EUN1f]|uniref:TetR/AcrR family transcriptional regulator n=1 Tax=Parafrankia sp. EUN1f TaxID=102897 RepID=UPI0001C468CD|nr:TetR/AcrR family transcriptional regulator [Parafrankia sp. EUN1f]EFC80487.1 transcriptional regulator, TetR family [Parafrankia sp. EUN1f]
MPRQRPSGGPAGDRGGASATGAEGAGPVRERSTDDSSGPVTASGRPKGGLRAAQRAFTHARFIDSAVIEFTERGYARTTVDDILARAGTTRATFYLHFRSKADILRELYDRVMAVFDGIYTDLDGLGCDPTVDGIRDWLRLDVERWAQVRQYAVPLAEGAVIEPEIKALVEQGYEYHIQSLARALFAGREDVKPEDAELAAVILLNPLMHFYDRYMHGRLTDTERMITLVTAAWMAIIKVPGR